MDEREREYEFIVVGSGAGGGPVAANLVREGHSVLVLEGGGPPCEDDYECQVPAFHTLASEKPAMSWEFFVRHYADEKQQGRDWKYQLSADKGGVFYPRAGTLGGCTAHNAMIFVSPCNEDWEAIARETGDDSWCAENMRRYFQRVEDCRYRPVRRLLARVLGWNPTRHGFGGWLATEQADPKLALEDRDLRRIIFKSASRALFGVANPLERVKSFFRTVLDPNDWRAVCGRLEGIRLTPISTLAGRRVGTRELLLSVQAKYPDRLAIRTGALVTRVLFEDGNRAVGVEYLEGLHTYRADPQFRPGQPKIARRVRATREVILAGGVFNTPQILQLSGIGPASLLERHKIPVRIDLPGVGANLQDRYEVSIVNKMKRPVRLLEGATMRPPVAPAKPDRFLQDWLDHGRGIYTTNGAVMAVLKKSSKARRDPDLLIFGLVTNFRGYYPRYSLDVSSAYDYFTWTILKGYTRNTSGHVAIRSCNPQDVPEINFNYFDPEHDPKGEDLEAVVEAIEFARKLMPPELIETEEKPGEKLTTREQLRQFVRDEAWGHHASGTCKIGRPDDRMAVVDSEFRVYGTQALRIVDASVFPRIPGLFIVSAVYTIAEKASDVILGKGAPR